MHLSPDDKDHKDLYKLLAALVVPRPIAVITTKNDDGTVNVAPFSFFNILIEKPPILAFGSGKRVDGRKKDTIRNIDNNREFTVNLMGYEHLKNVHMSSITLDPNESELPVSGLKTVESKKISAPRLAEAQVSFECTASSSMMASDKCYIILGEIISMYVNDEIIDGSNDYIDLDKYDPIGRLYGGKYIRVKTADIIQLESPDA